MSPQNNNQKQPQLTNLVVTELLTLQNFITWTVFTIGGSAVYFSLMNGVAALTSNDLKQDAAIKLQAAIISELRDATLETKLHRESTLKAVQQLADIQKSQSKDIQAISATMIELGVKLDIKLKDRGR